MACKKYRDLTSLYLAEPEKRISSQWKSHAGSCKQCKLDLIQIQEQRQMHKLLKSRFKNLKNEVSGLPAVPANLDTLKKRLQLIEKPEKNGFEKQKAKTTDIGFSRIWQLFNRLTLPRIALASSTLVLFFALGYIFNNFYLSKSQGPMESVAMKSEMDMIVAKADLDKKDKRSPLPERSKKKPFKSPASAAMKRSGKAPAKEKIKTPDPTIQDENISTGSSLEINKLRQNKSELKKTESKDSDDFIAMPKKGKQKKKSFNERRSAPSIEGKRTKRIFQEEEKHFAKSPSKDLDYKKTKSELEKEKEELWKKLKKKPNDKKLQSRLKIVLKKLKAKKELRKLKKFIEMNAK